MDLPDAVYDGIVHGIGFRKDRTPDRKEWSDLGCLEDSCEIDHQVRSPRHEPEGNGHQSYLYEMINVLLFKAHR